MQKENSVPLRMGSRRPTRTHPQSEYLGDAHMNEIRLRNDVLIGFQRQMEIWIWVFRCGYEEWDSGSESGVGSLDWDWDWEG